MMFNLIAVPSVKQYLFMACMFKQRGGDVVAWIQPLEGSGNAQVQVAWEINCRQRTVVCVVPGAE